MTRKTTAPRKARPAASDDAAFLKLFNEWKIADDAFHEASHHAEAVENSLKDKLPKLPDLAIALGYQHADLLYSTLKDRLRTIKKDAEDFRKKYPNEGRLYNGALSPREGNEAAAIKRVLPGILKLAKAERAVDSHPAVKAARKAKKGADDNAERLFGKLVNTPANSAEGIAMKLREWVNMDISLSDPPGYPDGAASGMERFAFSALRDLLRLAKDGRAAP